MKRMLINATHSEEIRVALADGQKLYNLDIDVPGEERKKGNIYKGKITRVEPSLEAAFVDYGANRHGFLPYKEISRSYYTEAANKAKERPPINVAIKEGTEVIIQVNKEERGNKGAAITTYISLAGRYLVYMPENPKAGGISRRIEGKARQELKATLSKINQPKNSGVIVRTAGIGRSSEELDWDLNYLDQVWTAIKAMAKTRPAPFFLYQESYIFIRALRDYLRPDVGEILIDNKEIYEKARDFMQQVMPHNLKKLSYYNDTIPLFSRYQIESQIQSAFAREVSLPSGGSIVIDHTEAMISIDINSARATKGADIEETALNTNLEAADEIARQLRIRDLGGLVVIDFIDMRNHKNQRSVEQQLNEAVSNDRARTQTTKISKFGLLEMSRQRLKSSINEASQFPCPRCSGHGFIRNIESLSVSIIRIMEEEALKPGTGKVIAQVPTKIANFIINEKREEINSLEARHSVPMLIIANEHYQSPQFDIKRLKKSEAKNVAYNDIPLNKPENEELAEIDSEQKAHMHRPKAAVDVLVPDSQVPSREEKTQEKEKKAAGIGSWLKSLFTSADSVEKPVAKPVKQSTNKVAKKPQKQHKKPQHNNQKQQAKGSQKNNKSKSRAPQYNKPKQQSKKPPVKKPQQTKLVENKKPVDNKRAVGAKVKADDKQKGSKVEEQLLQRPLGSVASYAANKAKSQTQEPSQVNNNKQKSASVTTKLKDAKPAEKKTSKKPEINNSKSKVQAKQNSEKQETIAVKETKETQKQIPITVDAKISSVPPKPKETKPSEKPTEKKPQVAKKQGDDKKTTSKSTDKPVEKTVAKEGNNKPEQTKEKKADVVNTPQAVKDKVEKTTPKQKSDKKQEPREVVKVSKEVVVSQTKKAEVIKEKEIKKAQKPSLKKTSTAEKKKPETDKTVEKASIKKEKDEVKVAKEVVKKVKKKPMPDITSDIDFDI